MPTALSSAAKDALFARLEPAARETYWDALSRFLRFEIDKGEFERLALPALGADGVALHNSELFRWTRHRGRALSRHWRLLRRFADDAASGRSDGPAG